MGTGATEALTLLLHWDGARLQWAVGQRGGCVSVGEELAEGSEHAIEVISNLKGKGLLADEVLWSNRHAPFVLVPDVLDGAAAFALEHGVRVPLRSVRSDRFEDGLTCWEQKDELVEEAVFKAWPMARMVSGTLAGLELAQRREEGKQGTAVYLDASPGRTGWSRWRDGKLRAAMASGERQPENLLYQIANSLHRDHTDPATARLYLSGEDVERLQLLFERFIGEVAPLEPFVEWDGKALNLKPARWAALWNLAACAS
jgi:hypothetical protein